ncbi:hypothetical protein BU25DRAFT_117201 [Macroventuria anomochaeta]|uniref:Uncharacterized protein n=1 Tax=Macroventuria anomochaeta TaxID=301207 RepID=A0ACB6RWH1_9PLEO|nr:uncharacterized protein BU25DRAFT_117201 [Macroventuria anomochaeta]KAF2625237.1 hypothetical protein BU25DRAFT_117201 [Macroventuria anomochaeta]
MTIEGRTAVLNEQFVVSLVKRVRLESQQLPRPEVFSRLYRSQITSLQYFLGDPVQMFLIAEEIAARSRFTTISAVCTGDDNSLRSCGATHRHHTKAASSSGVKYDIAKVALGGSRDFIIFGASEEYRSRRRWKSTSRLDVACCSCHYAIPFVGGKGSTDSHHVRD